MSIAYLRSLRAPKNTLSPSDKSFLLACEKAFKRNQDLIVEFPWLEENDSEMADKLDFFLIGVKSSKVWENGICKQLG